MSLNPEEKVGRAQGSGNPKLDAPLERITVLMRQLRDRHELVDLGLGRWPPVSLRCEHSEDFLLAFDPRRRRRLHKDDSGFALRGRADRLEWTRDLDRMNVQIAVPSCLSRTLRHVIVIREAGSNNGMPSWSVKLHFNRLGLIRGVDYGRADRLAIDVYGHLRILVSGLVLVRFYGQLVIPFHRKFHIV